VDGNPVGEPSPFKDIDGADGGEESPAVSAGTFTEAFRTIFPQYLAIGMSYDEFWRMDASLARDYRIANEIRQKNEEWARWRQGAYFYDALLRVAPVMRAFGKGKVEAGKYPEEPWPMTAKEARALEERKRKERFERMLAMFNKESAENEKKKTTVSD